MVRGILLHFWLAYDHPFEDGNGRTARALFYWYMRTRRYWLVEYLSISRILRNAPAKYAKSFLATKTDDGDLTYFINYQLLVIKRARHYLGYTEDLEARVTAHRAGRGSPLVAAAVRDGIDFCVAATSPGDRTEERRLHRYRNSPQRLCPICRNKPGPDAPAAVRSDATDGTLVDALGALGEPVTLAALQAHLRRRAIPPVGGAHGRLELLARAGRVRKTTLLGELAWELEAA